MVKHRIVVLAPLVVLPLILLDPEQPSVGRMAWTVASNGSRLLCICLLWALACCYVPDTEHLSVLKLNRYPQTTAELRRAYRRQALRCLACLCAARYTAPIST